MVIILFVPPPRSKFLAYAQLMRLTKVCTALVGLLALTPNVMANVIEPSIVDMICAPLPQTLNSAFVGAIITVPTLLLIAGLEAMIVKRLAKVERMKRLFWWLLLGNTISSIFGLFTEFRAEGSIYPSWWGFPVAWLLSAIIESPFVRRALTKQVCNYRMALRYSFIANAASYAALAVLVLAMTAIPLYQSDPTGLLKELRGQLLIYNPQHQLWAFESLPSAKLTCIVREDQPRPQGFCGSSFGRMFLTDSNCNAVEVSKSNESWVVASQATILPGRLVAVGSDGETLVCITTNQFVLIDRQGKRKTVNFGDEEGPQYAALSRDGRYLVYTTGRSMSYHLRDLMMQDLSTGATSTVSKTVGNRIGFHPQENLLALVPYPTDWPWRVKVVRVGTNQPEVVFPQPFDRIISNLAWSPDGKYLSFVQTGGPSWLSSRYSDVSLWVVTADGRRSAPMPVSLHVAGARIRPWHVAWRND